MRKVIACLGMVGLVLSLLATSPASWAQDRRLSLIRDAEIETIIRDFATPIFRAAGLSPGAVNVYLVNDRQSNAFVSGGQNVFLHTGLLLDVRDPGELLGVIAHETGHIAGGHLARGQAAMDRSRMAALVTTLLGAAAVAAGGGEAGAAVMSGGQSFAERSFTAYTRDMENAADQAALAYLDRAGLSAEGLLTFLDRLADQDLLPSSRQNVYVRTHPMARERVDAVRAHLARSPAAAAGFPAGSQERLDRLQAKLMGYLDPDRALRRFGGGAGVADRYGVAIAEWRRGNLPAAEAGMTALIAAEPDNPYFQEILGQMLLENGRIAEARQRYEQANRMLPGEPSIQVALAHSQIESGDEASLRQAVQNLNAALQRPDGQSAFAWRLLAIAQGRLGDFGLSALALAEEALALGDGQAARERAARALQSIGPGQPGYQRALDVEGAAERLHLQQQERRR